jgi:hypothetical protein
MRLSSSQLGEEAVHERVHHRVKQEWPLGGGHVLSGGAPAQLFEGGAVVAVHGNEIPAGEKAVDLDESVPVLVGAVGDEQEEVVVLVEFWPLAEVGGVFDGQRVKAEQVPEHGEVRVVRAVHVEPEELVLLHVPRDRGAVDVVVRALHVDEKAARCRGHRSPSGPALRDATAPRRSTPEGSLSGPPSAPSFHARHVKTV